MDSNGERGSGESAPKYVWDPQKLAWVEKSEPREEAPAERPAERSVGEASIVEAVGEAAQAEETVEVEAMHYLGAWLRLGAFVIDFFLLAAIEWVMTRFIPGGAYMWYMVAGIYFVGLWLWRGQTLGKIVIGAKVVKSDGTSIGLGNALLRYVVFAAYFAIYSFGSKYISVWGAAFFMMLVFLVIVFNIKKRGLHDLVAGTCVINIRRRALQPVEVASDEQPGTDEPETGKQH